VTDCEPKPGTIEHARATFRHWLGEEYDLVVLDVVLAVAATEQLDGDPPWLLVVSGPGNAKTETVVSLVGIGAHMVSTIASEGALLSATAKKETTKEANGGLLRKIGPRGLLVIKDFTSILSMSRDARAQVLGALREVYDGKWDRTVGTDGGRMLTWAGRIVLIGAVTTSYDAAHSVISAMGDRFALVRADSSAGATRLAAGRQALRNVGNEAQMRADLSEAAGKLLASLDFTAAEVDDRTQDLLLEVANLVTLARTAVERDYRGDVVDAHAPEMPTRFAKMLGQVVRGARAIGLSRDEALQAAVRVAGDSMPPLRLAVLVDVSAHPKSRTSDVRKRLQKPRNTIDRELQALHILGLLVQEEALAPGAGEIGGGWLYSLTPEVDPNVLSILASRNGCLRVFGVLEEGGAIRATTSGDTAKPGHQDPSGSPNAAPLDLWSGFDATAVPDDWAA
jgi:hypothetical protein